MSEPAAKTQPTKRFERFQLPHEPTRQDINELFYRLTGNDAEADRAAEEEKPAA